MKSFLIVTNGIVMMQIWYWKLITIVYLHAKVGAEVGMQNARHWPPYPEWPTMKSVDLKNKAISLE
jgi:hypothetical protein